MRATKVRGGSGMRALCSYPWSLMGFLLLCMVVPKLYELSYLFWVGRVSAQALGIAEQHEFLSITIEVISEASAVGVLSLVARANGRRDGVLGALRAGLYVSLVGSGGLSLLLWLAPQSCIKVMGTPPALVSASCAYLRLRACGLPFDAVGLVLLTALKALGRARLALAIIAAGMLLNAGLDVLTFSDTRLSLHLGITGMALGFVVSRVAICTMAAVACQRVIGIGVRDLSLGLGRSLSGFLSTGGWAGMDSLVRNIGYAAMLTVLNALGGPAFAGYGLAMTIIWTAILPVLALTEGTNITVGRLFGEKRYLEMDRALWVSLALVLVTMGILVILGLTGWRFTSGVLNPHPEIVDVSYQVFLSLAVAYVLFAPSQILKSLFIGSGRTANLFLVSLLINGILIIPYVIVVRRSERLPEFGSVMRVFGAALILDFIITSMLAWRLRRAIAS